MRSGNLLWLVKRKIVNLSYPAFRERAFPPVDNEVPEVADGLIVFAPACPCPLSRWLRVVISDFPRLSGPPDSSRSTRSRYSIKACFTILLAERDKVGSGEGAFARAITQS